MSRSTCNFPPMSPTFLPTVAKVIGLRMLNLPCNYLITYSMIRSQHNELRSCKTMCLNITG